MSLLIILEQFAFKVLRYQIPGWEDLTLKSKTSLLPYSGQELGA
jgi:hypothetical protein